MSSRMSSVRSNAPRTVTVEDHRFLLAFGRGARMRQIAMPVQLAYALATLLPVLGAAYLGATAYLFFRDDMMSALMARHAHQQYAYEDRLAALRLQLDRVASRQMLDQDSFDGKLRDMASRQARIETRAMMLTSLGDAVGAIPGDADTRVKPAPASVAITKGRPAPAPTSDVGGPLDNPDPVTRPRPDDTGLRPSADAAPAATSNLASASLTLTDVASSEMPPGLRVGVLATSIEKTERVQLSALRRLEAPAQALATKLRAAVAATGLAVERLKAPLVSKPDAVGGPFVPLRIDPHASEFDAQLARTQAAVVSLDTMRRIVPALPLRKPLAGSLEQTSTFGYRLDPFLGRPALHSGIDFRGEYGSAVRATAGGKVVTAGWSGGYGNMVEIEHGNGIATRYGHLSSILVSEGQSVQPGSAIGRVGSTGRSTGNHLHYEVRLDDDAVDPSRFIRAASMLDGN